MGEKLFRMQGRSTVRTEIIAGITTFLATMYIIVVNPAVLSDAGMPYNGVLTATVLVSAFSSIMMGLYANTPMVIAPGMGINAFFTYSVVKGMDLSWETALGAVFWSGVVFLLLSVFNIRTHIVRAIPRQIRFGVAGGIGIFISLIGLKNAGFVVPNEDTLVAMAPLNLRIVTFLIGLAVTSILVVKRYKTALIFGVAVTSLLAIPLGRFWGSGDPVVVWEGFFRMPDFSLLFSLDLAGSLRLSLWNVIFAFLFTDMFDSLSTFMGVSEAADLKDENGQPLNIRKSLIVDSFATISAGLFGTSSGTVFIESSAGIEEGGRTGLTAVVAGLLFLPFMFFSPLLKVVPDLAVAPALVLVGVFMIKPVLHINWNRMDDAIPAFLALTLIPLTYSITNGIIWGLLSWTVIKLIEKKFDEVSWTLIAVDIAAVVSLVSMAGAGG
ncbi:MAG: NCS2 family permease [Fibrobacterota bacterium]